MSLPKDVDIEDFLPLLRRPRLLPRGSVGKKGRFGYKYPPIERAERLNFDRPYKPHVPPPETAGNRPRRRIPEPAPEPKTPKTPKTADRAQKDQPGRKVRKLFRSAASHWAQKERPADPPPTEWAQKPEPAIERPLPLPPHLHFEKRGNLVFQNIVPRQFVSKPIPLDRIRRIYNTLTVKGWSPWQANIWRRQYDTGVRILRFMVYKNDFSKVFIFSNFVIGGEIIVAFDAQAGVKVRQ